MSFSASINSRKTHKTIEMTTVLTVNISVVVEAVAGWVAGCVRERAHSSAPEWIRFPLFCVMSPLRVVFDEIVKQ